MKLVYTFLALCFFPSAFSFFSEIYYSVLEKLNYEVCDDSYITPNFRELRRNLQEMLFGQHIIIEKLIPVLESHFTVQPTKALVICMHGWTGSGKNYVTKIILDALFKKKSESEFIRIFNGRLHFPVDEKKYVDQYKLNIQQWIQGNVTKCPRSVFIFDEIDKMPAGIIDGVKPFLDYYEKLDSIDYRKSIFFFISNIGGNAINSRYMDLWRSGKSRLDMEYKDFEPYLRSALYQNNGAFEKSSVLEGHLVSLYLPFLPLSQEQVEKCIMAEFNRQGWGYATEKQINAVLDEMEFNSDGFSTSGCKRVSDFVATFMYKKRYQEL